MRLFDESALNVLRKNIGGKYTIGEAVGLLGGLSHRLNKQSAAVEPPTTAETHIVKDTKQPDTTEKLKVEELPEHPADIEPKKKQMTSKEAALNILSRPNGVDNLLFVTKVLGALKNK